MLDVLEHLANPLEALRAVAGVLKPEGSLILSVPNMAHASVRLQLLQGHFPAAEEGLLDRTHLRFFDETVLRDTIDASPFYCESLDRILLDLQPEHVAQALAAVGLEMTAGFEIIIRSSEASTYQFVARLRHRRSDDPVGGNPRSEYVAPLEMYWSALRGAETRAAALDKKLAERIRTSISLPKWLRWIKRIRARLRKELPS
jgi:hypothetical protein